MAIIDSVRNHWPLTVDAVDGPGNDDGTLNGTVSFSGGYALFPGGSSNYINFPAVDIQDSGVTSDSFSIRVFVNPTVAPPTGYGTILADATAGAGMFYLSTGELSWYTFSAGSDHKSGVGSVPLSTVSECVFTYNGSTGAWNWYINGALTNSGVQMGLVAYDLTKMGGHPGVATWAYTGYINQVTTWHRELSSGEVASLFNGGLLYPFLADGLMSYWSLDGNSTDLHGTNNGTDTAITYGPAHLNQGAFGNGTSSYINVGAANLNLTGDLTVAAWVYVGTNSSPTRFILTRCLANGGASNTYEFRLQGFQLQFLTYSGNGQAAGGTVAANTWTFCCATRSGNDLKVYMDGVLVGTGTQLAAPTSLPAQPTLIGSRADGNTYLGLDGFALDEVGIWNRALSFEEVRDLWSCSNGYPLDPVPFFPMFTEQMFEDDSFFDIPFDNIFVAEVDFGDLSDVYANELDFPSRGAVSENIFQVRMAEAYGGADVVIPPVISNMSPASGTPIYPTTAISFDITDESGLFTAVIVMASFADGNYEVIYDSAQFSNRYRTSTFAEITNGYQFVCRRNGGWPSAPTFKIVGIDRTGGENVQ